MTPARKAGAALARNTDHILAALAAAVALATTMARTLARKAPVMGI
jgi:hypothetical protein